MSRCYPFPPPGYEKKIVIDDIVVVDVLSKEKKHRKRKHREKKDGKVNKNKGGSRDKKDRKNDRKEDRSKNLLTSDDKASPEVRLNSVNGAAANSNGLQTGENRNSRTRNDGKEVAGRIRVQEQVNGEKRKEKNGSRGRIFREIRLVDQENVRRNSRTDDGNDRFHPEPNGTDEIGEKGKRRDGKSEEKAELSNGHAKAVISGKRKELEINGFPHENGSRPRKLRRPVSVSVSVSSSPRNPETEKHRTDPDAAELKNGLMAVALRKVGSKASRRPPHQDSVLLDRILALPEPERSPDFDDQEWLLGRRGSVEMHRGEMDSLSRRRMVVWSHGTRIEPVGVFALPYVVPH